MMKTIAEICIVAVMCFAASSTEAYVAGARRLDKPRKPKPVLAECASCAKKLPRESLANGFCSKCWCKDHRKMKTNGVCRQCKIDSMMKKGTARCGICGKTSKDALLYNDSSSKSIEFWCIDHWCPKHNACYLRVGSNYVCIACEDIRRQEEEKSREDAAKKAELMKERQLRTMHAVLTEEYRKWKLVADKAWPELHCEVHKWKAEYAPRFGGDYYTADAKAKYAQNYMKALELQDKGLLKCMCHDSELIAYWKECAVVAEKAKKRLEQFELKYMAEK